MTGEPSDKETVGNPSVDKPDAHKRTTDKDFADDRSTEDRAVDEVAVDEGVVDDRVVDVADVDVEASRLVRVVAGLVLIVLSGTALAGVFGIRSPDGFDPQGPRFFPLLVTTAWLLLSIAYLFESLRATRRTPVAAGTGDHLTGGGSATGRRSWFEPVAVSGLLILYAFLVVPLGYVIATALLFFAAARVLGSRQTGRDVIVSLVLSIVVYIAFTRFLDISLPEGVLGL